MFDAAPSCCCISLSVHATIIVQQLMGWVCAVDSNTRSIDLFKAAGFGSVQRVQGLIDQNVDPNVGVVHGRTPLMQAASWGHAECVRALVAGRADICAKDPGGKTAIFLAQVICG